MPYRAQRGGQFGGGVQRQPAAGLDGTGVVDALIGGANQLVTQAYLRKQAKAAEAIQAEDRRLRLEDRQLAMTRQQRLDAIAEEDRKRAIAETERARTVEDAKLRADGYVPEQQVQLPNPGLAAGAPMAAFAPVEQAFKAPARFDPRQSARYQLEQEAAARKAAEQLAAEQRAHARTLEIEARRAAREERVARIRAETSGGSGGTKSAAERSKWIRTRAATLSRGDPAKGITAVPWEKATAQAASEYDSVGGGAPAASPTNGPARGPAPAASASVVDRAESLIRSGKGTLQQAEAAGLSPAAIAELRRRLGAK